MTKPLKRRGRISKKVRKVVEYLCNQCRTAYSSRKDAERCANRPREKIEFKKGDSVTWLSWAVCGHRGDSRSFPINGTVTKIKKPKPVDEDYSYRHLGGQLKNMHVWLYQVDFPCLCDKNRLRSILLYSAELKRRTKTLRPPSRKTTRTSPRKK